MQLESLEQKTLFVYDLEFVGDVSNPSTCQIWDLAFYCVNTREMFRSVVDPNPATMYFPPPPTPECMYLTREFLHRHRAKTFDAVFMKLLRWVYNRTKGTPVFISHNNFRSDKPVLTHECARYNISMPPTWMFFDSLLFIRDNFSFQEYNMDYLVHTVLDTTAKNAHRASSDTFHLHRILSALTDNFNTIHGEIQPFQYTSLRCVSGIGKTVQKYFFEAGIYNLEMVQYTLQRFYVHGAQTGCNVHILIRRWLGHILSDMPDDSRIRVHRAITA